MKLESAQLIFLDLSEDTGRFIVKLPNGRKFYVEPIGNPRTAFGDINPATKQVEGGYGDKYRGSIDESKSLLTEENGFTNIVTLPPGVSPLDYISNLNK